MERLAELAKVFGTGAQIVSALVAVVALGGIYAQIRTNLGISRETAMREAYRSYLALAIQHPKLADPTPEVIAHADPESARYPWFVSYLLYTCELVMANSGDDEGWAKACEENIRPHANELCGAELRDEVKTMELSVQAMVAKTIAASQAPACLKR
ncbi:MAG: hypothetical protein IPL88_07495 [Rhizobiales bacterium]|nr:hypothetical protein [Hyphomicrobiales bacterium]